MLTSENRVAGSDRNSVERGLTPTKDALNPHQSDITNKTIYFPKSKTNAREKMS